MGRTEEAMESNDMRLQVGTRDGKPVYFSREALQDLYAYHGMSAVQELKQAIRQGTALTMPEADFDALFEGTP